MKLHRYIYALWVAVAVMAASLASCSDHSFGGEDAGSDGGGKFQLGLNVVLPCMDGSRATYEPGNTYENTVNLAGNDYKLLLFTADTRTLVCAFDPADVTYAMSSTPYYRVCTFRADVAEDITEYKDLKMVMVANWGAYPALQPGVTTIDDLAGYSPTTEAVAADGPATFSASRQLVATEGKYIPLYGVREFNNITWLKGAETWLGDLWLLRSVAKIEVRSADGVPPVESVVLTRYNDKGACAPKLLYSEVQYVAGTDRYKPMDYVTLPGDANDSDPKNYSVADPQQKGDPFVVYVPEYKILDDYSKPQDPRADMPVLNVKFKGVDQVYQLEFKYYTDEAAADNEAAKGDYFDIRRNYIYRYNLSLADAGIVWDVDVLPYASVDLNPDFGLLLASVSLNKYVCKLYVDREAVTNSSDLLIAYDENNMPLSADKVTWRLSKTIDNHVCDIKKNADGTCTVTPKPGKIGRDIVEAVILDKNDFEVTAECVIESTERYLGLEKTFLGLVPYDIYPKYSFGSFRVNIVAERDQDSKLSWVVLGADDKPLDPDLERMLTVTAVNGDGSPVENGGSVSEKNITINVQAGILADGLGEAHVWVYYEGPDYEYPDDPSKRRTYSTYCDVEVSNVSLTVYPTVLQMTVGQSTSITASTTPVFSDYIPSKAVVSENTDVVTVDNNGLVNAVGVGTTRIRVTSDDELLSWLKPQYVEVTVAPDNLLLLREDGTPAIHVELLSNESVKLKAMSNGKDVSATAKWDIVDDKFVTVSNGTVTAGYAAGTSTVRVTYTVGGVSYSEKCIVEVATERVLMIQDYPRGVTVNASVPMKAYIYPDSRPQEQRTYDVAWKSSNTSVVAFDDPEDKALAIAKTSGTVNITATTTYNGKTYSATSQLTVLGYVPDIETNLTLKIYNAKGAYVKTINTVYAPYPGVNVGGDGKFDKIVIPPGETWTAVAEFDPPVVPTSPDNWSKYQRYSFHQDRINIAPSSDGQSCKITSKNLTDGITTRYNEVYFKVTYNGKEYTRAFCVYAFQ